MQHITVKKATHHEALKYLENKKTILDMIPKIIDFTVSLFSSIITFIITTLFQPHNFQLNLLYSIAAFALQYIILLIVNRKNSLALNVFGCFIPTVYLYKLKKHINSL